MPDGTYTAVIDRIVDGKHAVLLIEDADAVIDQRVVSRTALPEEGQTEGMVLEVVFDDDEIVDIAVKPEVTEQRKQAAQERFERLSERPPARETDDSE